MWHHVVTACCAYCSSYNMIPHVLQKKKKKKKYTRKKKPLQWKQMSLMLCPLLLKSLASGKEMYILKPFSSWFIQ